MNSKDTTSRLEALLARVVARKDAPRAPRAAALLSTAAAPPEAPAPIAAFPLPPVDEQPDLEMHTPLGGDSGQGPEIDLAERTVDLDIPMLEATLAASEEYLADDLNDLEPPAPQVELPPLSFEADDLTPLRAPTPAPAPPIALVEPEPVAVLRAPSRPPVVLEPEVEPEAITPMRPPVRVSAAPPMTGRTTTQSYEARELPASAAAVLVVAMEPPAPRTLREMLARSLSLKVASAPRG